MIPQEVLTARAVWHMEGALMIAKAGDAERAQPEIEKALDYLRRLGE